MGSNKNALTKERVVEAAEECFRRYGIHRTSMTDVAATLGVARQTLYRVFDTRGKLLAHLAAKRISELGEALKPQFARFQSLEEALVEGSLISVRSGVEDELLSEVFRHSDDHSFEQFLFKGSPEIQAVMLEIWSPLIDDARQHGRLRQEFTNEEVVEWIRNVHAMLTLRDDYDDETVRKVLANFFVPSVLD
jgi:AcrR family transcriptional regulator